MASELASDSPFDHLVLQATIYYDPKTQFARFSTVEELSTVHMKSPFDGSDLTFPVQEITTLTTQLSDN